MKKWKIVLCSLLLVFAGAASVMAQDKSPEDLAKESEEKSVETAKEPATPEIIMKKVDEAVALLEKEGVQAFPKFQGKDSNFIFNGTYIWLHDMEGMMRMHPIKYKMNGTRLLNLKDVNGKIFFVVMNEVCAKQGSGWVEYMWPKPGEKESSPKVSYVKLAKTKDGEIVVGSGVYHITKADLEKKGIVVN